MREISAAVFLILTTSFGLAQSEVDQIVINQKVLGAEGHGAFGQTFPNLPMGGKLRPDASKGDTGVWVNGRQLHGTDVAYLQQCTPVIPGRYWLDAHGNGGVEGGPIQWNLALLCSSARQRAGGSFRGRFGSVLGDGTTTGAIFRTPSGGVAGVTCGPDGGCIY